MDTPAETALIVCQSAGHALRLHKIGFDLGLRVTYFPVGGTDAAHDQAVTHNLGVMGDPQKVNDFVRNYGL